MTKQEIIDKLDDYLMYVSGDEKLKDIYIEKQIKVVIGESNVKD